MKPILTPRFFIATFILLCSALTTFANGKFYRGYDHIQVAQITDDDRAEEAVMFSCSPPSWLGTYSITATSASLEWSAVSGATSYSVQWRYGGGNWTDLPGGPWYNPHVYLGGLQPGTTYEWRVKSNCPYGYGPWSYPTSFTTLGASCQAPSGLHAYNITEHQATLSWSSVSGAYSYSVQIKDSYGSWTYVPGSPFHSTWVTVNNLHPNTHYEWRVRANCHYGDHSAWTYPSHFTTPGHSYCQAPYWLGTFNITEHSATWDWNDVSGAYSYSVQWRYPGGHWYDLPGGPFHSSWVSVNSLQPNTTYEWRVRSNCGHYGSYSDWSYPTTFTTLGPSCYPPTGLWSSEITSTSVKLSWTNVPGAHGYYVQIRWPNGSWTYVHGSPFHYNWAYVTGLSPNTTYYWRVKAYCSYSEHSYWSHEQWFTTGGQLYCHPPSWLGTMNITQTTATFDWSSVSGASSYEVQYRVLGGDWQYYPGGPFYQTWLNATGLHPGTTYEWRVRANCHYGNYSAWSYHVKFTTQGASCYNQATLTQVQ